MENKNFNPIYIIVTKKSIFRGFVGTIWIGRRYSKNANYWLVIYLSCGIYFNCS